MTLQDTVTVPSTPDGVGRALDFLDAALAAGKIPELIHAPVHLAVDEALQNIISYSGAAAITIMIGSIIEVRLLTAASTSSS